jgi:hypothetical protein
MTDSTNKKQGKGIKKTDSDCQRVLEAASGNYEPANINTGCLPKKN